jgi:hypothetical protein
MMRAITLLVAAVLPLVLAPSAIAQGHAANTPTPVPVKVQITLIRYRGDVKVSSLPFALTINADDGMFMADGRYVAYNPTRLRTKTVVAPEALSAAGKDASAGVSDGTASKAIGTNIDCSARSADGGRFKIDVSIDDTSLYADSRSTGGASPSANTPVFRTFQSSNTALLKDGQTAEFTSATDRITGEITKVEIGLKVLPQ